MKKRGETSIGRALVRATAIGAAFAAGWWAAPRPGPQGPATGSGGTRAEPPFAAGASSSPERPGFEESAWRSELGVAAEIADPFDRHSALLRLARQAARSSNQEALRGAFADLPGARAAIVEAVNGEFSVLEAFTRLINPEEIDLSDFTTLFARDPARWLALSYGEHGHSVLQSAADAWLSEMGIAALKVADGLPPEARTRVIERALSGSEPDIMNPSLLPWIKELTAERILKLDELLPAEAARDPSAAAALLNELPSSVTVDGEVIYRAYASAILAFGDPERAETLVTTDDLSPEARSDLEQGFVAAVQGIFTSPHDGLLRAISVKDPGLRSRAVAAVILNQESPDTLGMLGPWLSAIPPERIDPQSLLEALRGIPESDPLWVSLALKDEGKGDKLRQRMAAGERMVSEAFSAPRDDDAPTQP